MEYGTFWKEWWVMICLSELAGTFDGFDVSRAVVTTHRGFHGVKKDVECDMNIEASPAQLSALMDSGEALVLDLGAVRFHAVVVSFSATMAGSVNVSVLGVSEPQYRRISDA